MEKEMRIKGMFRDWDFGRYTITYNNGEYSLWICNGFSYFQDDGGQRLLLKYLPWYVRLKIWREYKTELYRRTIEVINNKMNHA